MTKKKEQAKDDVLVPLGKDTVPPENPNTFKKDQVEIVAEESKKGKKKGKKKKKSLIKRFFIFLFILILIVVVLGAIVYVGINVGMINL